MDNREFAHHLNSLSAEGKEFAVATVIRTSGSSLAKPGFKVIMSDSGEVLFGGLGGACPEGAIAEHVRKVLESGIPRIINIHLAEATDALKMSFKVKSENDIYVETFCGGSMEIYLEPFNLRDRVIIAGQGGRDEVLDDVVEFSRSLGFETVVIEHSPELTVEPDKVIDEIGYDLSAFDFRPTDSVVILTKGTRDIEIIKALKGKKVRYIGMLASRKRRDYDYEELKKIGFGDEFLSAIHSPIGIDINAKTPKEIALSIIAELVMSKRITEKP